LVLINGLELDNYLEELTTKTADTSKDIPTIDGNPHIWLSVINAKKIVSNIYESLTPLYPEDSQTLTKNYNALEKELTELDQKFSSTLTNLKQDTFIVYHNAFPYLAHDYNLTQYALTQDEEEEASTQVIKDALDFIKAQNIKCVFFPEDDVSAADTFKEAGVEVRKLDTLELVDKKSYNQRMQANLDALQYALA
jgi:ABC-type Zn uptake system ZnuABC Zn-binding protein ZnuA